MKSTLISFDLFIPRSHYYPWEIKKIARGNNLDLFLDKEKTCNYGFDIDYYYVLTGSPTNIRYFLHEIDAICDLEYFEEYLDQLKAKQEKEEE